VGPVLEEHIDAAEARVNRALSLIALARPACDDAALTLDELATGGAMLKHASANLRARLQAQVPHSRALAPSIRCRLDEDAEVIIRDFDNAWLQRSRPGGLQDSMSAWRALRGYYHNT
jgi:hypothetical protein